MTARQMENWLSDWAEAHGGDWQVNAGVAHECMWYTEIRLTLHPNAFERPDESAVFYSAGNRDLMAGYVKCFEAARQWLSKNGTEEVSHEQVDARDLR